MITKRVRLRACRGAAIAVSIAMGMAVGPAQPAQAKIDEEAGARIPSTQKPSVIPTWYALKLGRLQGRLAVAHYWSRGEKFRALTLINGKPVLTIVNGPYYYTIDLAAQTGVRIKRNPFATAVDGLYSRPFAKEWEELVAAGGEKVDEETVVGRPTEVWRLTNRSGRRTIWVSKERLMVPVRIETYDRKTARRDSVEYMNWQLGIAIPEQFFEPPQGVKLQTFEYDAYITAARAGPVGPAPPLYRALLHGARSQSN